MTQKRSLLRGWTPGGTLALGAADVQAGPTPTGLVSVLLRPTAPPLKWGLLVAVTLVVVETLVLYPLKRIAPENTLGVVYLIGVVAVAIAWGFWLAAATTVTSVLAFDYFHIEPVFAFSPTESGDWVTIAMFLIVALAASTLAGLARARAAEASQHRRQVEASRDELSVLADQQAALRRVATLVARGGTPPEVFDAVADELAHCLGVVNAGLLRFEADGTGYVVAVRYEPGISTMPVTGEHIALGGDDVGALVLRTGRAARVDNHDDATGPEAARIRAGGIGSIVGVPIIVDGTLWGATIVGSTTAEPMPADTDTLLADFAHLVATAIGNAAARADLRASRDELQVLADQQAALQRVATLVARGASPPDVFSAVAAELARVLAVQHGSVWRYEPDGAAILLAASDEPGAKKTPVGDRFTLEGDNLAAMVLHTGRPARMDSLDEAAGSAAARIRDLGIRAAVAAPIIVEGLLWGVASVASLRPEPLPPDTETRVCDFADLAATAIANAESRTELTASRTRIVAAADDARRRIERDLHDGAQQRLVSLALEMRTAEASVPPELSEFKEQLSHLIAGLAGASEDLQEIARGIHPAILSRGGLAPALKTLARRSAVPVELDLHLDRQLPDSVEVGAYYVVAEALTNAAKHARASQISVHVACGGAVLHLSIHDDGIGGADTANGSGLVGLADRVAALGGQLTVSSQPGRGTSLAAKIPLDAAQ
ncbi:MAG: domain S-box [Mycobacterium sp.]|nr:domain S-box [Mycobacterium sp.]